MWSWRKSRLAGPGDEALRSASSSPAGKAFRRLDPRRRGYITRADIEAALLEAGILEGDPRLQGIRSAIAALKHPDRITVSDFESLTEAVPFLLRAVGGGLVIPEFARFSDDVRQMADEAALLKSGRPATYIPELANVNPDQFAVALCTIDGQRASLRDKDAAFSVQSVCKPLIYSIALELLGRDAVHAHVGREPSGQRFNALTLNGDNLPHNPMINAGAIACCSLIRPDRPIAERFRLIKTSIEAAAGGSPIGFSSSVYSSERDTAYRNYALAYFMRENGVFPEGSDLHEALDLYFQCCSIEATAEQLAVVAATFAFGGFCPLTEERVFSNRTVKHCLSMMFTNGMYDYSGEFAFLIGLPAKSGISGGVLVVVPGIMGLAMFSPRVDERGNSVRGVEMCKRLVHRFNFHQFDAIWPLSGKADPRAYPAD